MSWDGVDALETRNLHYRQSLSDALIAERFGIPKREVTKKRQCFGISSKNQAVEVAIFEYYNQTGKWPTDGMVQMFGYTRAATK